MQIEKSISIAKKISLVSSFIFTLLYFFSIISLTFTIRIVALISLSNCIYLISKTYIDNGIIKNRYTIDGLIALLIFIFCEIYLY